jgi:hypothetical protein
VVRTAVLHVEFRTSEVAVCRSGGWTRRPSDCQVDAERAPARVGLANCLSLAGAFAEATRILEGALGRFPRTKPGLAMTSSWRFLTRPDTTHGFALSTALT